MYACFVFGHFKVWSIGNYRNAIPHCIQPIYSLGCAENIFLCEFCFIILRLLGKINICKYHHFQYVILPQGGGGGVQTSYGFFNSGTLLAVFLYEIIFTLYVQILFNILLYSTYMCDFWTHLNFDPDLYFNLIHILVQAIRIQGTAAW